MYVMMTQKSENHPRYPSDLIWEARSHMSRPETVLVPVCVWCDRQFGQSTAVAGHQTHTGACCVQPMAGEAGEEVRPFLAWPSVLLL